MTTATPEGYGQLELEALRRYSSPTVANAIETFKIRPRQEGNLASGIRALFPEQGPLAGYAVTLLIRAEPAKVDGHRASTFAWWDHIQTIPGPRIIVAHDLDEPRGQGAQWGEVHVCLSKWAGSGSDPATFSTGTSTAW